MNLTSVMLTTLIPNVPIYKVYVMPIDGMSVMYSEVGTYGLKPLSFSNAVNKYTLTSGIIPVNMIITAYDDVGNVGVLRIFNVHDTHNLATIHTAQIETLELNLISNTNTPFNTIGSMVDDNGIDVTSEVTIITTSGSKVSTTSVTGVFNLDTPETPYYAISDDGNSVRILERQGTISDLPLDFVMESTTVGVQYNADGFVYDAEGNPLGQTVVITATGEEPTVLGVGVSDPTTGQYLISVGSWSGEVMAYTHQNYGIEFSGNVDVLANSVVHPTTPNQYVYKIITPGKLPTVEPVWPTEIRVFDLGTATAEPVKLLEPQMAGWFKVKAV